MIRQNVLSGSWTLPHNQKIVQSKQKENLEDWFLTVPTLVSLYGRVNNSCHLPLLIVIFRCVLRNSLLRHPSDCHFHSTSAISPRTKGLQWLRWCNMQSWNKNWMSQLTPLWCSPQICRCQSSDSQLASSAGNSICWQGGRRSPSTPPSPHLLNSSAQIVWYFVINTPYISLAV